MVPQQSAERPWRADRADFLHAGFIFGGAGGNGTLLVRDNPGNWSYPAFYTVSSGSVGLQAGAEVAEVILMIRSQRGADAMLSNSFKVGTDASVAAGPVGAGAQVQTSDILAFSRSKGLYGGVNLDGSVISPVMPGTRHIIGGRSGQRISWSATMSPTDRPTACATA